MDIIGILHNNSEKFLEGHKLHSNEFKYLIKRKDFCLLRYSNDSQKTFFYSEFNNIHLFLLGHITNLDEIISHNSYLKVDSLKDILDFLIKEYLLIEEEFFSHLDGSYVVILWDDNKKKLYINRDAYGTKLLYYYFSPNEGVFFSNNLDVLLKVIGGENISSKALHEYLRFLYISPPYTIYENIYFLETEKILVTDGKEIILRNISTQASHERYKILPLVDIVKDFENLLYESIRVRIKDASKVGVFLSGGIDSTLICALATKIKNDIKVYTVGFDDPKYDESKVAREITNYLGIKHEVFKFDLKDDYNAFNEFTAKIPSPFADPAIIPTFQCFKHISDHTDVVLDGTGGDSLIGIMPARYVRFILTYSRHIPYKLRFFISKIFKINKMLSHYRPLFDFQDPEEVLIIWKGWTKREISLLCDKKCDLSHTRHYKIFSENFKKGPFNLYSMLIGASQDDRIHFTSALFGLNVAFPFWDKNVQIFVKKLPTEYRYKNGISKVLFRRLLKDYIPSSIWDKPKQGFNYPFEKLLRYNECTLPKTLLSKDAINEHRLFDYSIVENYLQRFLNGDNTVSFKIWALVVFQAWYVNYYKVCA